MKSGKPAQAATERYPSSSNTWALAEYRSKPIASRQPHDFTTRQSGIDAASALGWVNSHAVQPGQVDDEAVGGAPAHETVAPAPNGDFQAVSASEFDGVPDIIGVGTPCDQGGASLRVGIPKIDASRCLITGVRGENETALQLCAELLESVRIDLASVVDFELTRGRRQPQRSGCGERLLDELATTLAGAKIHEWEALIV